MTIDRTSYAHLPVHQRGLDLLARTQSGKAPPPDSSTSTVSCAHQAVEPATVSETHSLACEIAAARNQNDCGQGQASVASGLGSMGRIVKTAFFTSLMFGTGLAPAAALARQ